MIFIIGVFLLIFSVTISTVIERVEDLDYNWYLILKVVSDGLLCLSISLMLFSYGWFLYENVKF